MKKSSLVFLAGAAAVIGAGAWYFTQSAPSAAQAKSVGGQQGPTTVNVIAPLRQDVPVVLQANGTVTPLSMVDLPGFLAVPNPLDRYTFNSVAPPPPEADGSLKIFLAAKSGSGVPESNLLPAPAGKPFSLTFRTYVPKDIVKRGAWFPPAIQKIK